RRYSNAEAEQNAEQNIDRNRRDRNDDIQYFRPEEIDRIEIEGRTLDDARFETRNVQVTLESNWIDSGVYLRRGERVQVSATGVSTVARAEVGPEGLSSIDPTVPWPNAGEGKLMGAVGRDPTAPITETGINSECTADRNGRLFLTANRGSYADA